MPIVTKMICCAVQELNIQYYIKKLYFIIHYSGGAKSPPRAVMLLLIMMKTAHKSNVYPMCATTTKKFELLLPR